MVTAGDLAGFFAAHAIWSVSEGDALIPLLAYATSAGERKMDRLALNDLADAVKLGRERLIENPMDAVDAVLLYDGRINIGSVKVDAIVIEARTYFSPESELVIAVPYSRNDAGVFRVHKPKIIMWKDCEDFDLETVTQAFFHGVSRHEKGSEIWEAALDESM